METIAIYWEPQIKTYAIDVEMGLCLLSATAAIGDLATRDGVLSFIQPAGKVMMVSATPHADGRMRIHCVTSAGGVPPDGDGAAGMAPGVRVTHGVALVYFHGPHYGDRYGIAVAALKALAEHGVTALSMACSGASVYIVVSENRSEDARMALSTAFVVPERESGIAK